MADSNNNQSSCSQNKRLSKKKKTPRPPVHQSVTVIYKQITFPPSSPSPLSDKPPHTSPLTTRIHNSRPFPTRVTPHDPHTQLQKSYTTFSQKFSTTKPQKHASFFFCTPTLSTHTRTHAQTHGLLVLTSIHPLISPHELFFNHSNRGGDLVCVRSCARGGGVVVVVVVVREH